MRTHLLLLLVLLAGCVDNGNRPTVDDESRPDSEDPGREVREAPYVATPTGALDLTHCEYAILSTLYGPQPTWPRPPGWPEPERPLFSYHYFDCTRVAWGLFERGPIRIMLVGDNFGIQDLPCEEGFHDVLLALIMFVDDSEFANAFQEELGLPVMLAAMSLVDANVGGVNQTTVKWIVEGYDESSAVLHHYLPRDHVDETMSRFVWFNETSMTGLDFILTYNSPSFPPGLAAAHVSEPPLNEPVADHVLGAQRRHNLNASGEITTWNNFDCRSS